MTSRKELEREIDDLREETSTGDGDPTLGISIERQWIMTRTRAEREGRQILGEYDGGPDDADLVIVDQHSTTAEERERLTEMFDVEPGT